MHQIASKFEKWGRLIPLFSRGFASDPQERERRERDNKEGEGEDREGKGGNGKGG